MDWRKETLFAEKPFVEILKDCYDPREKGIVNVDNVLDVAVGSLHIGSVSNKVFPHWRISHCNWGKQELLDLVVSQVGCDFIDQRIDLMDVIVVQRRREGYLVFLRLVHWVDSLVD